MLVEALVLMALKALEGLLTQGKDALMLIEKYGVKNLVHTINKGRLLV